MTEQSDDVAVPSPPEAKEQLEQALFEIRRVIAGQDAMLERVLVCLLAQGHLLIEGVPGLAKTLTIKTTAGVLGGSFARVQFTPDLVPSDLVGHTNLPGRRRRIRHRARPGLLQLPPRRRDQPRTRQGSVRPPRGDAGAAGDDRPRHVSRFPIPSSSWRRRTRSSRRAPIRLPEAQIDRFMLKVVIGYPQHDEELTVVQRQLVEAPDLREALSLEDLKALQRAAFDIYVDPSLVSYAVDIATATREPAAHGLGEIAPYISYGASPRGPISLVHGSRALALIRGREYALVEDLQALAKDALRHRLVLSYQALAEEVNPDELLDQVLAAVPAPRLDLAGENAA